MTQKTAKIVNIKTAESEYMTEDISYFSPCIKYICREAREANLPETAQILTTALKVLEQELDKRDKLLRRSPH